MQGTPVATNDRLYRDVARKIVAGHYRVGSRLPAERELAASWVR